MANPFGCRGSFSVGSRSYTYYRFAPIYEAFAGSDRLPFSLKILLENLLRKEDGNVVREDDIAALAKWDPNKPSTREIAYMPARVLLQDFTGVPAIVDLAAMRDAMVRMGGDPRKINPLIPAELVIDHSVQVDNFGTELAFLSNAEKEFQRNRERYMFLRWGQTAFSNFKVVPPDTGIVHQINLEYLARVVFVDDSGTAYPDTVIGTDSHTTMINGLGVLGWGVGGIEAEAAMLGQSVSMLIPEVIGFKLTGKLPEGATATDLVLTVTEMLRKKGVVGKFVEFYGPGLAELPLADRATIANMAPEYGATCGIFPVDEETLRFLRFSGRPTELVNLVEAYTKEQGLFHTASTPEAVYTDSVSLDLKSVEPSLAGPSRPQDRVRLSEVKKTFAAALPDLLSKAKPKPGEAEVRVDLTANRTTVINRDWTVYESANSGEDESKATVQNKSHLTNLRHGSVVIAAITSCTNTSNPSVMVAAGLVAKKAIARGLKTQPWVKTSLAPGSKVVTEYLADAGLDRSLNELGFNLVGYGCTSCIGNAGPLNDSIASVINGENLVVASVLSGNRNFEGRVHGEVRANFLASPPLVVAYALAGRVDIDLTNEPIGMGSDGTPVYLRDIWPTQAEVAEVLTRSVRSEMFTSTYASVYEGDANWQSLPVPTGDLYAWDPASTYVKNPPYFEGMKPEPEAVREITGARVLAVLANSITTDHISPAGAIKASGPAGAYLLARGVTALDFNSYGARRGNHEVMVRGTFANLRLKNLLAPGTEGGVTRYLPTNEVMSIFEASEKYIAAGTPLIVLAGKEYGSGSSRDWAAKGPNLLGIKVAIAESYERIHRSNLVGMGILPLQFRPGETVTTLGLTGEELYDIVGLPELLATGNTTGKELTVKVRKEDVWEKSFQAIVRIDTPQEIKYYQHGGILPFVLRQLLEQK